MSRPQKSTGQKKTGGPRQKQTGQRKKVKKQLAPAKTLSGITAFQDAQGRVAVWPSDRRLDAQTAVLEHLAAFVEGGRTYPEREVLALLRKEVSLEDLGVLVEELVEREYLRRDAAAGTYWLATGRPTSLPAEAGGG